MEFFQLFPGNVKVNTKLFITFFRKETDFQGKLETSTVNLLSRIFALQGSFIIQIWKWGICRLEMDQMKTRQIIVSDSSFSLPVTIPVSSCNCAFQKFVLVIIKTIRYFVVYIFLSYESVYPWSKKDLILSTIMII